MISIITDITIVVIFLVIACMFYLHYTKPFDIYVPPGYGYVDDDPPGGDEEDHKCKDKDYDKDKDNFGFCY